MNNESTVNPPGSGGMATPAPSGLQDADIAAIVMGTILLIFVITTVIICILIKKGYICRAPEDDSKIMPVGIPCISTSPESIRDCSFAAMDSYRKQSTQRQKKGNTEPIIYMYDDVYHPPSSRPMPDGKMKVDPYPEIVPQVRMPSRQSKHKTRKHRVPVQQNHREQTSTYQTEQHVKQNKDIIPSDGRINITTYYGAKGPYTL